MIPHSRGKLRGPGGVRPIKKALSNDVLLDAFRRGKKLSFYNIYLRLLSHECSHPDTAKILVLSKHYRTLSVREILMKIRDCIKSD